MKIIILSILNVIFKFIFTLLASSLILGLFTMILWNFVIPEIFYLKEITFFQAWTLNLLSSFLLKNSNFNLFDRKNLPTQQSPDIKTTNLNKLPKKI